MEADLEQRTLAAEDRHWWYRGRRAIVLDAAKRVQGDGRPRILDAGCGGGGVMAELAQLGEVVGLEPSPVSRAQALARGAGQVLDGSLEGLPFDDAAFDLALTLDVLEHLDDDRGGLGELRRVVRPGGFLIVTVPAHPRLWSRHDDINHHRRRYTRPTLRSAAEESGWEVVRLSHFNSVLLPVALLARVIDRGDGLSIPPAPINGALEAVLQMERFAIRGGLSLPAGLSLLAVLRR
jgi:SAM-dependent methyltransferase